MRHVSIFIEGLRSQPRLMFWLATLAQAAIWWLVPSIFYAAPPGELPMVLAVGHELQLGTELTQVLDQVVGEGVVVVDHEDAHG